MTSNLRFRAQLVRWRPAHRSPAPPPARTLADIDAGSITNTTTASGNGVASSVVSVTVIANQAMSIDLVDSATTPTFSSPPVAGDTINFSYKITNTGNVTLSGVVLIDASLPGFETPGG